MIAQRLYDERIGPVIERDLAASGVAFRLVEDGGDARRDDEKDGNAFSESETVALADGMSAVLRWGMVNCTHMDWEGVLPQERSGTAFVRVDFLGTDGKDAGSLVVVARYSSPAWTLMPRFREWRVGVWRAPSAYPAVAPHPRIVELAGTLGVRDGDILTDEGARRLVPALAAFIAATRS